MGSNAQQTDRGSSYIEFPSISFFDRYKWNSWNARPVVRPHQELNHSLFCSCARFPSSSQILRFESQALAAIPLASHTTGIDPDSYAKGVYPRALGRRILLHSIVTVLPIHLIDADKSVHRSLAPHDARPAVSSIPTLPWKPSSLHRGHRHCRPRSLPRWRL